MLCKVNLSNAPNYADVFTGLRVSDPLAGSTIGFDLKDIDIYTLSKDERDSYDQIYQGILDKFPGSHFNRENMIAPFTIIFPNEANEALENAVRSSSLFQAAGDLSQCDLESLLLLQKKLILYKIADNNLSALVDRLETRIRTYLAQNFAPGMILEAEPKAQKKFGAMLAISEQAYMFNAQLRGLTTLLLELIKKGTPNRGATPNEDYDPNYASIAPVATSLYYNLKEAGKLFFNNPISNESFEKFNRTCLEAINKSKVEFGKYRGPATWYSELHPILQSLVDGMKVIAGILAGITVVPAVLIEVYSEKGYIGTFFKTEKTDPLIKLETFEEKLCAKEGIFEELNEGISSLGII